MCAWQKMSVDDWVATSAKLSLTIFKSIFVRKVLVIYLKPRLIPCPNYRYAEMELAKRRCGTTKRTTGFALVYGPDCCLKPAICPDHPSIFSATSTHARCVCLRPALPLPRPLAHSAQLCIVSTEHVPEEPPLRSLCMLCAEQGSACAPALPGHARTSGA